VNGPEMRVGGSREGGGFPVTLRHHVYLRTGPAGGAGTPLGDAYPSDLVPNLEIEGISVKIGKSETDSSRGSTSGLLRISLFVRAEERGERATCSFSVVHVLGPSKATGELAAGRPGPERFRARPLGLGHLEAPAEESVSAPPPAR